MREHLCFALENSGTQQLEFAPSYLINAGYSGRSRADIQAHVEELRLLGISAPDQTPCFFAKTPFMVNQEAEMEALDQDCSSEAEYVVFCRGGVWYLTCGADVFDKMVEPMDTAKSKHIYCNKIAKTVWQLEEVQDHFDQLVIRSWQGRNRAALYQESVLAHILPPQMLLQYRKDYGKGEAEEGLVLYSGTFPALTPGMPFTDYFEVELTDPVLNRSISCGYSLSLLK